MPENETKNNDINQIITEAYASKGQDFLFRGEDGQDDVLGHHPMNNALERPIDWEVLNKIQFYNQLSCLAGNDLEDGLFGLKEPYRSEMEAEYGEEMGRVEAEYANEENHLRVQECHGVGNGNPQERAFGGASNNEGGTNA